MKSMTRKESRRIEKKKPQRSCLRHSSSGRGAADDVGRGRVFQKTGREPGWWGGAQVKEESKRERVVK